MGIPVCRNPQRSRVADRDLRSRLLPTSNPQTDEPPRASPSEHVCKSKAKCVRVRGQTPDDKMKRVPHRITGIPSGKAPEKETENIPCGSRSRGLQVKSPTLYQLSQGDGSSISAELPLHQCSSEMQTQTLLLPLDRSSIEGSRCWSCPFQSVKRCQSVICYVAPHSHPSQATTNTAQSRHVEWW